jgi:hypothetical protein
VTADATGRPQSGRYREIADELRLLAPKMKYAEVAKQLRLLAISFDRLAEHAEESSSHRSSHDSGDLPDG